MSANTKLRKRIALAKLRVVRKRPRSTSMSSRTQQTGPLGGRKRNQEQRSYVPTCQRQASNYWFSICSCSMKVIQARGWRFAPACCAAQSVFRRGPGYALPLYRLAWAALNLHLLSELHQPSASAGSMKTAHASLSFGVRRPKWCGLTGRSTGHFAAVRVWASKA